MARFKICQPLFLLLNDLGGSSGHERLIAEFVLALGNFVRQPGNFFTKTCMLCLGVHLNLEKEFGATDEGNWCSWGIAFKLLFISNNFYFR